MAAVIVLGVYTIARFPIFDGVDEGAHIAYIAEAAQHQRIPYEGRDLVPWQVFSIQQHVYPRHSPLALREVGLAGLSYEAWQPPLYYALAAPAFLIAHDYLQRVRAVRAFDLALVMAALALLARLAREVFAERWHVPYALALSVLLWPGVLVRAITVSNEALALPLACLFLLLAWRAVAHPSPGRLLALAVCLALCLATQLTLVCLTPVLFAASVALVRARPGRSAVAWGIVGVLTPVALLAPWLAMNISRYGAPIDSSGAERITAANFPPGPRSGLGALHSGLGRFGHALLPQEWWPEYRGFGGVAMVLLAALPLLPVAVVAARPSLLRSRAALLLAAPLLLCLGALIVVALKDSWPPALFPRYLNPLLGPLALFAAWAAMQVRPRVAHGSLLAIAGASTLAIGGVWLFMALSYYSPRVGASFGIHANAPP